jgi:hypothetical protein
MNKQPATRAFPATLPEWNHLDRTAKLWAIRHEDRKRASRDPMAASNGKIAPAARANETEGLVFWIDPHDGNSAKIRFLRSQENALRIVEEA